MLGQYQTKPEESTTSSETIVPKDQEDLPELESNAFDDAQYVYELYNTLVREYSSDGGIIDTYANIERARNSFPPFWNPDLNAPAKLPMYQYNISSGIFNHSMMMVALTYNSFFPNKSYAKKLIDISIVPDELTKKEQLVNPISLQDKATYLEHAVDNLIKNLPWSKRAHVQMVADLMHFDYGMFYFPSKDALKYDAIDVRKVKVPSGTGIDPDDWEYIFVEEDMPLHTLYNHYKKKTKGWDVDTIGEMFNTRLASRSSEAVDRGVLPNRLAQVDGLREGISLCALTKVAPTYIPIVNLFWKDDTGKVNVRKFFHPSFTGHPNKYLYKKDAAYDRFSHAFSLFLLSDEVKELRMVRSWARKLFPLTHSYDRTFCKFLDAIDQASTLFLKISPNDVAKKILNLGSIVVGQFEEARKLPHSLEPIIASLQVLENKINQTIFFTGLSRTEMQGEGRGAELARTILTAEGRVHKHLMERFIESYTRHMMEVLRKILHIANNKGLLAINDDVKVRFVDYLQSKDVEEEFLKGDSFSELNYGLPSSWVVSCNYPDGTGITPNISHTLELLGPYISSLPESGFKFLLSKVIAEAFGDPDIVDKVFPEQEIDQLSSALDEQMAEIKANMLITQRSEFDKPLEMDEEISPEATDGAKFLSFQANRTNDHIIYLSTYLNTAEEAMQRYSRREIGRTTLHIWLFNLVSSCTNHVQLLRADKVRGNRPEANMLYQKYGEMFNLLRQVESQANADRQKKLDALQKELAEQEENNPKRIEANAKLMTARARFAEAQIKFAANGLRQQLSVAQNRREEETHAIDKAQRIGNIRQSTVGRPRNNDQRKASPNE